MCDPISMTLISAGMSAMGTLMQAQTQAAQASMQAQMYKRQAFMEREAGAQKADQANREGLRVQGAQRAGQAASGIDIGTGSALDTRVDSAVEVQRDVDAIRWNAAVQEDNAKYKARESKWNAAQIKKGGYLDALVPLINGATQIQGYYG